MRKGPGWIPWIISAAKSSAATTLDGIRVRKGGQPPPKAELLADSGPATPSMARGQTSGILEQRFSTAYDTKEERTVLPRG